MSRRLSVTLPDEVVEQVEALAEGSGKRKSEVVRELLASAGVRARKEPRDIKNLLARAAAFRARQSEEVDVVALLHEAREERDRQLDEALGDGDE
jgi:metal-responsive CopG/Arc/MetJ family transcriptional regulator